MVANCKLFKFLISIVHLVLEFHLDIQSKNASPITTLSIGYIFVNLIFIIKKIKDL